MESRKNKIRCQQTEEAHRPSKCQDAGGSALLVSISQVSGSVELALRYTTLDIRCTP